MKENGSENSHEAPQTSSASERIDEAVRLRRQRMARWAEEGERSIGKNIAMIGALGWTIVIPTLLGIFVGRWIDARLDSGVFWTLGLLTLGLALGCWMAWHRMHKE